MKFTYNDILTISKNSNFIDEAAEWFSLKWGIDKSAYINSIADSFSAEKGIPRWYVVKNENGKIIAGLGVIENDFHKRKDLSPNVCAVFVEKEYRRNGIAKMLLDNVCRDMKCEGYDTLYLTTEHTDFYEKCGWDFYCMVEDDDGSMSRMYIHKDK